MDERRLLLAVALSLLVLTAYRLMYPSVAPSPAPVRPAASAAPTAPPTPSAEASQPGPAPSPTPEPETNVAAERETRVEVVGREVTVAFTNRGARIVSWKLQRYADGEGRPEEMVMAASGTARPLDVETGDADVDNRLRDALFVPSADELQLDPRGQGEIRFSFAAADLAAEKRIRFREGGYLAAVQVSVRKGGREVPTRVVWGPGVTNPTTAEMGVQGALPPRGVALGDAGLQHFEVAKLATPVQPGRVRWAGVEARYFAALWIPAEGSTVEIRSIKLPPNADGEAPQAPVAAALLDSGSAEAQLFVGPKDYDWLTRFGYGLEHVVPVGEWLGPIVVWFMRLLRFMHGLVGSYGWAIVLLTVMINLAMAPLRHYGIANGMRMAKLSPQIKAIQERYRGVSLRDPRHQDMQREMQELYARHGMSMGTQMAVGCLPLLLTMPFLFAIYNVLAISIDMRGASFLWIPDMSQKDPLYITPVLMGVSMFVMQRTMPTTMDPAQQRIMTLMPLMFVVFLFAAPGGLNLYWLASNLCSIAQQTVTLAILRARGEHPHPAKDKEKEKGKRR